MQRILVICTMLTASLITSKAQEDPINLYHQKYGNLDVDAILASPRLVSNYVDCLLNKKPCPPEGKALKKILPEALRTKCGRCLPSQKEGALKVITALYYQYPQSYQALRERWDPTGVYHRRLEEYLRDQKFNIIGSNGGDSLDAGDQYQGSTAIANATQRPIRQDDRVTARPDTVPSAVLPDIGNRFGEDTDEDTGYKYPTPKPLSPATTTTTAQPVFEWLEAQSNMQQSNSPMTNRVRNLTTIRPLSIVNNTNTSNTNISTTIIHQTAAPTVVGGSSSSNSNRPVAPLPAKFPTQSPSTWHTNVHTSSGHPATSTYYLQTKNPVLNVINRITMKFANTAEFIAGMLRATIPQDVQSNLKVEQTSHHHKLCQKFKKILWSHHFEHHSH